MRSTRFTPASIAATIIVGAILVWAYREVFPTTERRFEKISRLPLLTSKVVNHTLTLTGPLDTEGYEEFEVSVDQATLAQWRQRSPLSSAGMWKTGPVTDAGVMYTDSGPSMEEFDAPGSLYALNNTPRGDEGEFLLINPNTSKAWLVVWW